MSSSDLVLIERIRAHATRRHKYAADARFLTIEVVNNPIPPSELIRWRISPHKKIVDENNIVRRERFKFQTDDCERLSVFLRADQMCGRKSRIENCYKWELMSDRTWTHICFRAR